MATPWKWKIKVMEDGSIHVLRKHRLWPFWLYLKESDGWDDDVKMVFDTTEEAECAIKKFLSDYEHDVSKKRLWRKSITSIS